MVGKGTTVVNCIEGQLQEKNTARTKGLWMAFVGFEKAFNRVPREVVWWTLRFLGVGEWLVSVVQSMY